ncbi:hypothetical protein KQX54_017825 [Cotesia glomerata]|uniref:Uncharacterized protein n=1 Tax=Cotesia glomerata TaxID=32391 RepID=A0AAV7J503_COTGL|nr:hypothetical protein KQX54_017825 [Cotesia glomerata]
MSGKYIFRTAEDGYLTQKNISLAFLRCIGVNVDDCTVVKEITAYKSYKLKYYDMMIEGSRFELRLTYDWPHLQ